MIPPSIQHLQVLSNKVTLNLLPLATWRANLKRTTVSLHGEAPQVSCVDRPHDQFAPLLGFSSPYVRARAEVGRANLLLCLPLQVSLSIEHRNRPVILVRYSPELLLQLMLMDYTLHQFHRVAKFYRSLERNMTGKH